MTNNATKPKLFKGSDLNVNPSQICNQALSIVRRLSTKKFAAYLVGGAVRDLILKIEPKDFDIVTDATPTQIKKIFLSSKIIGRRFQIVHVQQDKKIFEVSTFQSKEMIEETSPVGNSKKIVQNTERFFDGRLSIIKEDAFRRDLSINALYYDPLEDKIIDFTGGVEDLNKKYLRILGSPGNRFREDPVRILRVIRVSAKLGFTIPPKIEKQIKKKLNLLKDVSKARLFDEILKTFLLGYGLNALKVMKEFNGLNIFIYDNPSRIRSKNTAKLYDILLASTDLRVRQKKYVSPHFLFAVLLWPSLMEEISKVNNKKFTVRKTLEIASRKLFDKESLLVSIPKRYVFKILDMWRMHLQLLMPNPKKDDVILKHRSFRSAYDFILIREAVGEDLQNLGVWWTEIQNYVGIDHENGIHKKNLKKASYLLNTEFYN